MSFPHTLSSLSVRESIVDALHRALLGFDINDYSLFQSAFLDDDGAVEVGGKTIQGTDALRTQLYDLVAKLDTTHMLSNVRVNVKEERDEASLSALSLSTHAPLGRGNEADGPKYTGGVLYLVDLAKDPRDGEWRIRKWTMKGIWGQGDRDVMKEIF